MNKLKLDIEALAVESFSANGGIGHGTVEGNVDPGATFQTLCLTDVGQCDTWACGPNTDYSCGTCAAQKTCGYVPSCVGTCATAGCQGVCDPYYSIARCARTDVQCA
jgi:hypothetical protein